MGLSFNVSKCDCKTVLSKTVQTEGNVMVQMNHMKRVPLSTTWLCCFENKFSCQPVLRPEQYYIVLLTKRE